MYIHFSPEFRKHLYNHYLELLISIDGLSLFCLTHFLRVYLVISFVTYSSVSSFCLTLCFSILGRSFMSLGIEGVASCRRCLVDFERFNTLLVTRNRCPGVSPVCVVYTIPHGWDMAAMGILVSWAVPWHGWLRGLLTVTMNILISGVLFVGVMILAETTCQMTTCQKPFWRDICQGL